jgi:2-polyprenyl-3-methyl-5-hydroxy-6-metoxy-1,4-benzoquinol methylase
MSINQGRLVVGCVAENTPKYLGQALRLVQSIRWFGAEINQAELYVCVVDDIREDFRDELERYGAKVRIVSRFSTKHPQSNKLRFLELPELAEFDRVLLLDCDTIVVRDPSTHLRDGEFTAKIVDVPTVPLDTFRRLFTAFELAMPEATQKCTVRGDLTIPYFNAGVLAFSRHAMDMLVPKWIELNKRLIERMDLLEDHKNYCEQASLSLAVAATGVSFKTVSNALNFPMHFEDPASAPGLVDVDPCIIHYHSLVDACGNILSSRYPLVNERIQEFNNRLRQERESGFNNRLFWNQRYAENLDLGSGVGSRGDLKIYKYRLLEETSARLQPRSILDVGCGDMEVSSGLPAKGYVGLDFSEVIVASNREKFPDRTFVAGSFLDVDIKPAEMVVCLDVLIHLSSPDEYRKFVRKLVRSTLKKGFVAGDEADPNLGGIVFFHEPLSRTLAEAGATNIRAIGIYRHVTIFEFSPPPPEHRNALIVLGMHRSGTSALTGVLSLAGVELGNALMPAHAEINSKGFWEHSEIVDVHERLLTALGSSWNDERELPGHWWESEAVQPFRQQIVAILRRDFSHVPLWGLKDPRMCRLMPLWMGIFRELECTPSFIVIARHPSEVAASLARRDGFHESRSCVLWLQHMLDAEAWTRGYPRVLITYDQVLTDWEAAMSAVEKMLSLRPALNIETARPEIGKFLEPSLRHYAAPGNAQTENVFLQLAMEAYAACLATRDLNQLAPVFERIRVETNRLVRMIAPWAGEIQARGHVRVELEDRARQVNALAGQVAQLTAEVERVKSSFSWQVTKPMRLVLFLARRVAKIFGYRAA